MAALRLMGKWSVPLATAVAVPLFSPVIHADSGSKEPTKLSSRMVRPSELPIYEEPQEVLDYEYHGRERTSLEDGIGVIRKEIEGVLEATRSTREKIVYICETGKAHTLATVDFIKNLPSPRASIDYITDEDNIIPRAGAITVGGLAGLVLGARKKGGLVKKALYTSTGVAAAASLCYPRQAYQLSQQGYENVKNYANIGYNFVAGVKPHSKVVPSPDMPKTELHAEPSKESAEAPSDPGENFTPPNEEPAVVPSEKPEGEEVRMISEASPDEKLHPSPLASPLDSLAQQSSDVMIWGFRLPEKKAPAEPKNAPNVSAVADADVSSVSVPVVVVPEGFGAVSEALESSSELEIPEGSVHDIGEHPSESLPQIPKVLESVVEEEAGKIAEEFAEKLGEGVVEKTAEIVAEFAQETEVEVKEVAEVAKVVDEVTEKEVSVIDVVKDVVEAADEATHNSSGMSESILDVAKEIIEESEKIVDTVQVISEKVVDVTEEINKETEIIKTEAFELMENKEKREELIGKVIDYAKTELMSEPIQEKEQVAISEPKTDATNVKKSEQEVTTSLIPMAKDEELPLSHSFEVREPEPLGEITEPQEKDLTLFNEPSVEKTSSVPTDISESTHEVHVLVKKEGLFNKLLTLFSKEEEKKLTQAQEESLRETGETNNDSTVSVKTEDVKEVIEEAILPVLEKVAEDIVEEAGEVVVEQVAEVVNDMSREVEQEAEVISESAEAVKEVGDKVESVLQVAEDVAEAAAEASKEVPSMPEIVEEKIEFVEKVAEEAEKIVQTVSSVVEKVEEIAKEVQEEAAFIEAKADELIESKEKREELVEKAVEFVTEVVDVIAEKVDDSQVVSKSVKGKEIFEGIEADSVLTELKNNALDADGTSRNTNVDIHSPEDPHIEKVQSEKKGLVDKLIKIFSKNDEKEDSKAVIEESTEPIEMIKDKPPKEVVVDSVSEPAIESVFTSDHESCDHQVTESSSAVEEPALEQVVEPSPGPVTKPTAEDSEAHPSFVSVSKSVPEVMSELVEPATKDRNEQDALEGSEQPIPSKEPTSEMNVHPDEEKGIINKLFHTFSNTGEQAAPVITGSDVPNADEQTEVTGDKSQDNVLVVSEGLQPTVGTEAPKEPAPLQIADELIREVDATLPGSIDVQEPFAAVIDETVSEVKETIKNENTGLFSKILNLLSDDKDDKLAVPVRNVSDEIAVTEPVCENMVIVEEPSEVAGEIKESLGDDTLGNEFVMVEKADVEDAATSKAVTIEAVTLSEDEAVGEDRGLLGKLVDLFSKGKEKDLEPATVTEVESVVEVPCTQAVESQEEKEIVVEAEELKEANQEVTVSITDSVAHTSELSESIKERKEGLFDKLVNLLSSDEKKKVDETVTTLESPVENQNLASEPALEEKKKQPSTVAEEAITEQVEGITSVENIADSTQIKSPLVTQATVSEEPVFEVKDESLFSKLADFLSTDDKKLDEPPSGKLLKEVKEDNLETPVEIQDDNMIEAEGESNASLHARDTESKPTLFDRVASLFSRDSEETQKHNHETTTDSSVEADNKLEKSSDENDQVFVVVSQPSSQVESPDPEGGGGQQPATQVSSGWLQGGWLRSSTVSQEGKDVIIQVESPAPEKDYGQSNPEDSDMYTTRS